MIRAERPSGGERYFDAKFRPEKMRLFGGAIKVVDITPEIPNPNKPRPVIEVPGWSTNLDASKGTLRVLEGKGRQVLSLTHMRHGGEVHMAYEEITERVTERLTAQQVDEITIAKNLAEQDDRWQFLLHNFSEVSLRRAMTLLGVIEAKGIEKADILAQSEGAIDAVIAKYLCPDKIGDFVVVAPGGMLGEDSARRIAKGNLKQVQLESKNNQPLPYSLTGDKERDAEFADKRNTMLEDHVTPLQSALNVTGYVGSNVVRAFNEARAIAQPVDFLFKAARREGSKITVIHGVGDPVFPMDEMQRRGKFTVDKYRNGKLVDRGSVDGFISVKGHHGMLFIDHRLMELADHAFTMMANPPQKEEGLTLW